MPDSSVLPLGGKRLDLGRTEKAAGYADLRSVRLYLSVLALRSEIDPDQTLHRQSGPNFPSKDYPLCTNLLPHLLGSDLSPMIARSVTPAAIH